METTTGVRIKEWRTKKSLSVEDFAEAAGVKPSAVYEWQKDKNKPGLDAVAALRKAYPDLNTEWLQFGDGPMLRDGRTLTQVVVADTQVAKQPTEGLTSGPATVAEAENILLKEQVTDLRADKLRLIAENEQLRKKSSDSPDAAGTTPAPTTPKTPTPTCGFMTAARREQLAAEFNRFLEEQEQAVEAAELS